MLCRGQPLQVLFRGLRLCSSVPSSVSQSPEAESTTSGRSRDGAVELDIMKSRDHFGIHKLFTVQDLFTARVHLGHTSMVEQMRPFVYGTRFGINVIDLNETTVLLRQALNFLAHVSSRGGIALFVARQPQIVHLVERTAIECSEYAHCRPWSSEVFCSPQLTFGCEVRLPDVIILLHTKDGSQYVEHKAIADSAKVGIPTIAVVDTDCNPNIITYPVPGNDDTLESIQLYLHLFKQAILLGKRERVDVGQKF